MEDLHLLAHTELHLVVLAVQVVMVVREVLQDLVDMADLEASVAPVVLEEVLLRKVTEHQVLEDRVDMEVSVVQEVQEVSAVQNQ